MSGSLNSLLLKQTLVALPPHGVGCWPHVPCHIAGLLAVVWFPGSPVRAPPADATSFVLLCCAVQDKKDEAGQ